MAEPSNQALRRTPLHDLHRELGGKMVAFAGYEMPVHYTAGILKEHLHTREQAGLFDVSHMGQRHLVGPNHETTARALEAFTPGDFQTLAAGRMRYSLLLDDSGGIIDDFMVTRAAASNEDGALGLVVNAARKEVDDGFIEARLPPGVKLRRSDDLALLALQGPSARTVMQRHCPKAASLFFMNATRAEFDGIECAISCSGYTGEDGFEISVTAEHAEPVARALLREPEVLPVGLGARDSLRLEAGLCLYGHDIDESTDPVTADLTWAIAKRRKLEKNFPGAKKIMSQIFDGARCERVGIRPDGKAPAREGTAVADKSGRVIGRITSGGFSPSVNGPVAMGYVESAYAGDATEVDLLVRGRALTARIAPLPFVAHRYRRAP